MTTLLQPIMSVFLKNKITHACHWKETTWNPDDRALVVNRGMKPNRVLRDANFLDFLNHIAQELGHPETIIIEPKNHREDWQLIFYSPHDDMAQESTITVRGAVEILSDGESHVIGKDASGELIELIKTPKKPARTIPYI